MSQTLRLQINLAQPGPAYRHVADSLRVLLSEGALQSGDRLPSSRRLAADLGVHFNTVAEAYRLLAEEGWLQLRSGRGAVVLLRSAPRSAPHTVLEYGLRLRRLIAEMRSAGITKTKIKVEFERALNGAKS